MKLTTITLFMAAIPLASLAVDNGVGNNREEVTFTMSGLTQSHKPCDITLNLKSKRDLNYDEVSISTYKKGEKIILPTMINGGIKAFDESQTVETLDRFTLEGVSVHYAELISGQRIIIATYPRLFANFRGNGSCTAIQESAE